MTAIPQAILWERRSCVVCVTHIVSYVIRWLFCSDESDKCFRLAFLLFVWLWIVSRSHNLVNSLGPDLFFGLENIYVQGCVWFCMFWSIWWAMENDCHSLSYLVMKDMLLYQCHSSSVIHMLECPVSDMGISVSISFLNKVTMFTRK